MKSPNKRNVTCMYVDNIAAGQADRRQEPETLGVPVDDILRFETWGGNRNLGESSTTSDFHPPYMRLVSISELLWSWGLEDLRFSGSENIQSQLHVCWHWTFQNERRALHGMNELNSSRMQGLPLDHNFIIAWLGR